MIRLFMPVLELLEYIYQVQIDIIANEFVAIFSLQSPGVY
jgi:hypothetical protein